MNKKIIAIGLQFEEIEPAAVRTRDIPGPDGRFSFRIRRLDRPPVEAEREEPPQRTAFRITRISDAQPRTANAEPERDPRIPTYLSIENSPGQTGPLWFDELLSIAKIRLPITTMLSDFNPAHYEVKFECPDYIHHLTGREIRIPMIEFNDYTSYARFCHMRGMRNPPQGFTMYLKDPQTMKPIPLIVYYDKQLPHGAMPPQQIKRHEAMHAVDPNIFLRDRREIYLTEFAAVIGEHVYHPADRESFYNKGPIRTFEGFWLGYYEKDGIINVTPGLLRVLKLRTNQADPATVVKRIVEFIHDLTSGRVIGYLSHQEIVLLLMSCRSFDELYEKIKLLKPDYFPNVEERPRSSQRFDAEFGELVTRLRDRMAYYYQNWPGAYRFTNKMISSLWQAENYAVQAMKLFVLARDIKERDQNVARALVNIALGIFNTNIDTVNILNFEIRIIPDGSNTRIIIVWP